MSGSSRALATRSILFSTSTTGTVTSLSSSEHVLVAVARPRRRVEHQHDDVHLAQRLDGGVHHPHVHAGAAADGCRACRRTRSARPRSSSPPTMRVPRRLRLVGDDGDLRADDAVEQRGLARVGAADDARRSPLSWRQRSASGCGRRRACRTRTLWMRRRSASSTSTCRPSSSNVSPTAGTRPTRVST